MLDTLFHSRANQSSGTDGNHITLSIIAHTLFSFWDLQIKTYFRHSNCILYNENK